MILDIIRIIKLYQTMHKFNKICYRDLKNFTNRKISLEKLLKQDEELAQQVLKSSQFHTESSTEYARYLKHEFGEKANDALKHENQHAQVAKKYGIKVIYGVMHTTNKTINYWQPFIIPHIIAATNNWNREKLLSFYKEIIQKTDNPSKHDKKILKIIQKG